MFKVAETMVRLPFSSGHGRGPSPTVGKWAHTLLVLFSLEGRDERVVRRGWPELSMQVSLSTK